MLCDKKLIYGWKREKGMSKPSKIIMVFDKDAVPNKLLFPLFDRIEICGGEIESRIELEYIPYMGGSDANIEVRFICKKCKSEHAGERELPYDIDSLNKFLTEIIKTWKQ